MVVPYGQMMMAMRMIRRMTLHLLWINWNLNRRQVSGLNKVASSAEERWKERWRGNNRKTIRTMLTLYSPISPPDQTRQTEMCRSGSLEDQRQTVWWSIEIGGIKRNGDQQSVDSCCSSARIIEISSNSTYLVYVHLDGVDSQSRAEKSRGLETTRARWYWFSALPLTDRQIMTVNSLLC